ncbi:MAG TPA: hypothetical protein C5S37_06105, partial [Methanophagales archaeon]|nr:hypothetical protein [Methanophagales archaeon]
LKNGVVVDQVIYGTGASNAPIPPTDKSTGRYPDGVDTDNYSADFRIFDTPTPGAPNTLPSPTTVSIAYISAPPDGSITAPIMVNNVTNLGVGRIKVAYNSSVVHVTDVASGTGNALVVKAYNITNSLGLVQILAIDATAPHSGDVIFATVTYKAVGNEGILSPLNITVRELGDYFNFTQIPHTITHGTFSVITSGEPAPTPTQTPSNGGDGGSSGGGATPALTPTPTTTPIPTLTETHTPTPGTTPTFTPPVSPTLTPASSPNHAPGMPAMVEQKQILIIGLVAFSIVAMITYVLFKYYRRGGS